MGTTAMGESSGVRSDVPGAQTREDAGQQWLRPLPDVRLFETAWRIAGNVG